VFVSKSVHIQVNKFIILNICVNKSAIFFSENPSFIQVKLGSEFVFGITCCQRYVPSLFA